jgi:hypothetical protein
VLVEQLDELSEVGQRAGEAVNLVDHDHVDLAGPHIGEEPLQGRPVDVAAGEAAVVVFDRSTSGTSSLMCVRTDLAAKTMRLAECQ